MEKKGREALRDVDLGLRSPDIWRKLYKGVNQARESILVSLFSAFQVYYGNTACIKWRESGNQSRI